MLLLELLLESRSLFSQLSQFSFLVELFVTSCYVALLPEFVLLGEDFGFFILGLETWEHGVDDEKANEYVDGN